MFYIYNNSIIIVHSEFTDTETEPSSVDVEPQVLKYMRFWWSSSDCGRLSTKTYLSTHLSLLCVHCTVSLMATIKIQSSGLLSLLHFMYSRAFSMCLMTAGNIRVLISAGRAVQGKQRRIGTDNGLSLHEGNSHVLLYRADGILK